MSLPQNTAPVSAARVAPPLGGFNFTAVLLELRRVLRNRRTLMFIVVFPGVFFYLFGMAGGASRRPGAPALAMVMVSMAVYGAMVGSTSAGAAVAVERSMGWSRQLRLTPLSPLAYVAMKVLTAMMLGLAAIVSTYTVGALAGAQLTASQWILTALAAWGGSCVFAAFGLFMGLLIASENVMQFAGPAMAIMAMFGGIFVPVALLPQGIQMVARFTPMYGIGELARSPLTGTLTTAAVTSVIVWAIIFGALAMLLFKRDTARV